LAYIRNLLQYRELFYFLWLREVKSKYKQTVLGIAWAVLQPLSLMLVFTVVFSFFARMPSDGVPYAVFSYCAVLPWQFFSSVVGRGSGGLVSNRVLVQKVYFPRELVPIAVDVSGVFGAGRLARSAGVSHSVRVRCGIDFDPRADQRVLPGYRPGCPRAASTVYVRDADHLSAEQCTAEISADLHSQSAGRYHRRLSQGVAS